MRTPPALLTLLASGVMLLTRAQAAPETSAASLERKIEDLRKDYETRIAALEKEVAELKAAGVAPPGTASNSGRDLKPTPAVHVTRDVHATAGGSSGMDRSASPSSAAAAEGGSAKSQAQLDLERQLAQELGGQPAGATPATPASPPSPGWTPAQPITAAGGGKNYLNISFDTLVAGGTSTTPGVGRIETGGHDPSQRGFTVQNVEAVLEGAVDPYFRGQGNIVLQIDAQGETNVELEEAYLTSTSLPHNLQVKAGQYFSEFGRLNSQHPHSWDFVDQPLVNGRFLGPDGLRGPGARLSWLMPTRFYSELFLSVQNSQGETAANFRSIPGESIFGRTIEERPLRTAGDLLYVPRYSASFDLADTQTLLLGASGAFGPNGTGQDTSTRIYGLDLFWKWKPANSQAGFPFVKIQSEGMYRRYDAGAFMADTNQDGTTDLVLPEETLRDRGGYAQILWGFTRGWIAGVRGDLVSGDEGAFRNDPERARRWRVAPNLTWFPTEFSKLRLQFNHDHREDAGSDESLWLQMEFLLGAHAAHKF